jgi:UDP-N-acetyl-D-mannosaminuronate dehydrogenase
MGKFVADAAIKQMIKVGKAPTKSKVVILGLTFKENCPDTRNSKVADVYNSLMEYGVQPIVIDPWASEHDAKHEYNIELKPMEDAKDADCVILAVDYINKPKQKKYGKTVKEAPEWLKKYAEEHKNIVQEEISLEEAEKILAELKEKNKVKNK